MISYREGITVLYVYYVLDKRPSTMMSTLIPFHPISQQHCFPLTFWAQHEPQIYQVDLKLPFGVSYSAPVPVCKPM